MGTVPERDLILEVSNLLRYFASLRKEIARLYLRHDERGLLENVHAQLDSVLDATEKATHEIITVLEEINSLAVSIQRNKSNPAEVESQCAQLRSLAVKGLESCTFQDVTGQRINRIFMSLRYVEECVDRIADSMGRKQIESLASKVPNQSFNAPGMVGRADTGINQGEIDRLFS